MGLSFLTSSEMGFISPFNVILKPNNMNMTRNDQERMEQLERAYHEERHRILNSDVDRTPTVGAFDKSPKLSPYEVVIKQTNNGFIVNVGCQSFVFTSLSVMFESLEMFFDAPMDTIDRFHNGKLLI